MNLELFKHIVDQLPETIEKIYLMKQGEPFLNKNLPLMIGYLRKRRPDIFVALHTNAIAPNKEKIEKTLPHLDALGISVSATDRDTYKIVHGTDHFDNVMKNIQHISDCMSKIKRDNRPHVFIDYVYQKNNSHEVEENVVNYFRNNFPGLSSVDFHWVYNFHGAIEEGNMQIYDKLPYDQFPCCVFPWSAMTICHDGMVSYCFVEARENSFLGDIKKQSFEEIWNGDPYRTFRRRMKGKKFKELSESGFGCGKCSWLWDLHAQSPRNLAGGYSSGSNVPKNIKFSSLMDLSYEQIYKLGNDYYLLGEIQEALGIYHFLMLSDTNQNNINTYRKMIDKCKKVLGKYYYLPLWKEKLQEESIPPKRKQCRYYHIAAEE